MRDLTLALSGTPKAGRVLRLGVITALLVAVLAAPAIATPRSAARPGVAAEDGSSHWRARPPLHHARGGLGVAKAGSQILAIGGFDGHHTFDVVEGRSATGTGTWHKLAPLATARANLATAEVGGLVYAVGGLDVGDNSVDVVEKFDPRSGHWSTSRPLPQPRSAPGAAGLDGLVYVAGGFIPLGGNDFEIAKSMVVYNPSKNTWRSVAPMPTARERLRLVASGHYLYAIGGSDLAGRSLTAVERYDPISNSWTSMNPMHESRVLPCAVETRVDERRVLVVVGGVEFSANGTFIDARRTTEVFDPATGRWRLLGVLLPAVRGSHDCATQADGTVLAIGGVTHVGPKFIYLANVDALTLKDNDLR